MKFEAITAQKNTVIMLKPSQIPEDILEALKVRLYDNIIHDLIMGTLHLMKDEYSPQKGIPKSSLDNIKRLFLSQKKMKY